MPLDVLVGFRAGTPAAIKEAAHRLGQASLVQRLSGLDVDLVRVPSRPVADALARLPGVEFVESNVAGAVALAPPEPSDDPSWNPFEWRLHRAATLHGWKRWPGRYFTAKTKPKNAVKVAVVDTWIDVAHPDFANRGGTSADSTRGGQIAIADTTRIVAADRQRGAFDWHGTFIAGIIAASANNARDIAGMGYGARIVAVTAAAGDGTISIADAAEGIMAGIRSGARVVNLSFAIAGDASATLDRAVERAADRRAILIAAAGNHASDEPMLPAALSPRHRNLVAVEASTVLDRRAACSGWGDHVTLAAPGTDIRSLKPGGGTMDVACGTSAATALVSAAAASIVATNPRLSGAAIRDRLERSADAVGGSTAPGRLNLDRAIAGPAAASVLVAGPLQSTPNDRVRVRGAVRAPARAAAVQLEIGSPAVLERHHLKAADGKWGGTRERIDAAIDVSSLAEGAHTAFVRVKDRRGRWGPRSSLAMIVDRTAPSVPDVTVDPMVVFPGQPGTRLEFTIADALSDRLAVTITFRNGSGELEASFDYTLTPGAYSAEWRGTKDAPGSQTFSRPPLPPGRYTVRVSAVDRAGLQSHRDADFLVGPSA